MRHFEAELKDEAGTPQGERNAATVRDLFDLTRGVGYHLLVLPQPVANPDRLSVSLSVLDGRIDGRPPGPVQIVDDRPLVTPLSTFLRLERTG